MNDTTRKGAVGALLDEYEHAVADLKKVIGTIPDHSLTIITDEQTGDENCRSVQAILSHVVNSGFGYATSIHHLKGHNTIRPQKIFHQTIKAYLEELDRMISFTENVLGEFSDNELEENENSLKIKAGWGQIYDVEQMMEHAIVHILRHRRQLEQIKKQQSWQ